MDERLDIGSCVRSELADSTRPEIVLVIRPSKVRGNRIGPVTSFNDVKAVGASQSALTTDNATGGVRGTQER